MLDWIPIDLYIPLYYHFMLILVLIVFFHTQILSINDSRNLLAIKRIGYFLLFFLLFYVGLRPIHGIFIDMKIYERIFYRINDAQFTIEEMIDPVFYIYTFIIGRLDSINFFFFISTALYIVPLFIVSKKWFKQYWFYSFFLLVISLTFLNFGVNGIRNGIAGSLFLLAISREKRTFQILIILLSIGFHKSMLIPSLAFILAQNYNKPKVMMFLWSLSIPISLVSGGFFESFFGSVGIMEDKSHYLLNLDANAESFSRTGFRWDFLIYSSVPIFVGWYFIIKKGFNDKVYNWLFITYIVTNAFWILVIRANFSNRFAYLSWFMMALVIVYPLLKQQFIINGNKKIGHVILVYFMFTYIMFLIGK